jgi:hypothetical protein
MARSCHEDIIFVEPHQLVLPYSPVDEPFRLIPYVQACKQRSGNSKLDIILDLQNICNVVDYHTHVLSSLIKGDCRLCLLDAGLDALFAEDSQVECPTFEQRIEEVANTIRVLLGDGPRDMSRWSSLHIALPYYEEVIKALAPAWVLLNGHTRSLTNLSIDGLDRWLELSGDEEEQFAQFPGPSDWSKVERLSFKNSAFRWIPVQWSSIKHLDITIDFQSDLLMVSNLISLETLEINLSALFDPTLIKSTQEAVNHYFPRLHSLSVTGYLPNGLFEAFKFEAPILKNFSIHLWETGRYMTENFDMKLPRISPRIVTFRDSEAYYDFARFSKVWSEIESEEAVRQFLRHFSSAEQIIFGGFTAKVIHKVLMEVIQDNQQCPISVYTERKGEFFRLHPTVMTESS